jgi:hypothetical protein
MELALGMIVGVGLACLGGAGALLAYNRRTARAELAAPAPARAERA